MPVKTGLCLTVYSLYNYLSIMCLIFIPDLSLCTIAHPLSLSLSVFLLPQLVF